MSFIHLNELFYFILRSLFTTRSCWVYTEAAHTCQAFTSCVLARSLFQPIMLNQSVFVWSENPHFTLHYSIRLCSITILPLNIIRSARPWVWDIHTLPNSRKFTLSFLGRDINVQRIQFPECVCVCGLKWDALNPGHACEDLHWSGRDTWTLTAWRYFSESVLV